MKSSGLWTGDQSGPLECVHAKRAVRGGYRAERDHQWGGVDRATRRGDGAGTGGAAHAGRARAVHRAVRRPSDGRLGQAPGQLDGSVFYAFNEYVKHQAGFRSAGAGAAAPVAIGSGVGLRRIGVDLRGYGETPRDATGWATPRRSAADVTNVLAWVASASHAAEAGAGGLVAGAAISQMVAQASPARMSALVLFGFVFDRMRSLSTQMAWTNRRWPEHSGRRGERLRLGKGHAARGDQSLRGAGAEG